MNFIILFLYINFSIVGTACGKLHRVCTLSVIEAGDSDILTVE